MRHYKKGRKLGTDASHTAAIKKNLMVNLFLNDRIKTTLERAKEIRGDVDRIVTWAKRGDVHSRRLAIAKLGDKALVAEIFAKVEQGLFKDRPGGYTRIFKVGKRRGDDATIVLMELVQEPVQFKNKAAADESSEKGGLKVEKKASKAKKATDAATEEAVLAETDEAEQSAQTEETSVVEADEAKEAAVEEAADAEQASDNEKEPVKDEAVSEETPAEEAIDAEEAPEAEQAPAEETADVAEPAEEADTDEGTSAEETPAEDVSQEAPEAEEAPTEDEPNK